MTTHSLCKRALLWFWVYYFICILFYIKGDFWFKFQWIFYKFIIFKWSVVRYGQPEIQRQNTQWFRIFVNVQIDSVNLFQKGFFFLVINKHFPGCVRIFFILLIWQYKVFEKLFHKKKTKRQKNRRQNAWQK